jgi:hypothetical protein
MQHSISKSKFGRVLLWAGLLGALLALLVLALSGVLTRSSDVPSSPEPVTTIETPPSRESSAPNLSTLAISTPNSADEASSDRDYSNIQLSDSGIYRVSYVASTSVIPINQMHRWTLHIETVEGQLVENATITVDGDMPEHGHGLPTRPQMTEYLGNGDYLIEGVKFQMGGWWIMDFSITANDQSDQVHFNLWLP